MPLNAKVRHENYIKRLKENPEKNAEYLANRVLYTKTWLEKDDNKRLSYMLSNYSRNDRVKGRDFNLTMQWCRENIVGKECDYCGTKELVGVDRIDNNIGHIESNCHPVCRKCNILKGRYRTHEEMLEFRKLVDEVGFEEARLSFMRSKEDIKLRIKKWQEVNKNFLYERRKCYRLKNKLKLKKAKQEYYLKNKEALSLKSKKNYLNNKAKIIQWQKEYAKENKEKVKQYKRRYKNKFKNRRSLNMKRYKSRVGYVFVTAMEVNMDFIKNPPPHLCEETQNVFLQKAGNSLYLYYKLEGDSFLIENGNYIGYNERDELSVWDGELFKNGFKEIA